MRPANEDAWLASPDSGLFAVADGMGGHVAGEVASRIAIETLRASSGSPEPGAATGVSTRNWLASRVAAANEAVWDAAQADLDLRGMGTTLTALYLAPPVACFAHVGDSRLYRLRSGRLQQLTRDHTWVQEQIDSGLLRVAQARAHPHRGVLTRAIGTGDAVPSDTGDVDLQAGDVFLLASDGLTGMLADDEIAALLSRRESLDNIAGMLIDEANARGGQDNITVVLVAVS